MQKNDSVQIAPSLICTDICNLEASIRDLEAIGIEMLHVDLLDGYFSPSMPIGLDVIKQLRKKTNMNFDVHIMVKENEFFIDEFIKMGIQRLCFHFETALHVDRLLGMLKSNNIKAGIAINPATPLSVLDYVVERCDFILLMLINPGYAGHKSEEQVPYAVKKVADCHKYLLDKNLNIEIEVDGRVSFENIPHLVASGARTLVAGSKSLFHCEDTLVNNLERMKKAINDGIKGVNT